MGVVFYLGRDEYLDLSLNRIGGVGRLYVGGTMFEYYFILIFFGGIRNRREGK